MPINKKFTKENISGPAILAIVPAGHGIPEEKDAADQTEDAEAVLTRGGAHVVGRAGPLRIHLAHLRDST